MPEASDGDAPALAAVVDKRRGDATIRSLRAEGIYDESRRVVEVDDEAAFAGDIDDVDGTGDGDVDAGAIAIPVTDTPVETEVREVVEQVDPEPRVKGLADMLAERGWTDEELAAVPSSWAVVGTVILARFEGCPRPEMVGEALLELHGEADTVLDRRGVGGVHREPDVSVVAGEGDTETVHVEHGTRYALDLSRVMFSPGNKAERARMGEIATAGEAVLDMFAGVGYFALPMARAGARVTAIEHNPVAFRYLLENASLNDVTDRLEPYRGDCRTVASRLPAARFDRVVMGYYDATAPAAELEDGPVDGSDHPYLDAAFHAVAPGGTVHVHAAVPTAELPDRPESRIATAAAAAGRGAEVSDWRVVKSHSEGVDHVVLDVAVG